jgi:DNA-binding transcriptional ArsR family regulator
MARLIGSGARAEHLAGILKTLGHPARLGITAALCEGRETVGELARQLGLPQAIVSQHLRILRMSGLVEASRHGGFSRYGLKQTRLRSLLRCLDGCAVPGPARESGAIRLSKGDMQ